MLDSLERRELGEILRRLRKNKGWSIENVVKMTNGLSQTTVSKIERGISTVGEEYLQLYCNFLGITPAKIPSLIQKESSDKEDTYRKLLRIEKITDLTDPDMAYKHLKEVPKPHDNHLKILYYHVEGRCLYGKRQYERASRKFNSAIQLLNSHPEMELTNIRAACYCELGRISFFYHNNLEQALHYTEEGLNSYKSDGMRKFIKLSLLSGKASYLEMMNKDEEALITVEELLNSEQHWHRSLDAILNAMEIKSQLCAKRGYYREALELAEEGIELARLNKHYSRAVELLTALGNICYKKGNHEEAEDWYLLALPLEKKIKQKYLFVSTHTRLGNLYMAQAKWEKAKMHLQKAVSLGEKNDDGIRYYAALVSFGDLYIKTHQADLAIPYLEKALELSERNRFPSVDPELFLRLSHCLEPSDPNRSQNYLARYKANKLEFN